MASLFKITVLGQGGVGKTAITIRLCNNQFISFYDPTIENSYRRQVMIDNEVAVLDILDTAGQEEFSALRNQWIRAGDGFVIMYSIDKRRTFDYIEEIRKLITESKDLAPDDIPPIVILGNKSDLERDGKREVSTQEGQELAKRLGAEFFETSAKDHINVEESFFELVRLCRQYTHKKLAQATNGSGSKIKGGEGDNKEGRNELSGSKRMLRGQWKKMKSSEMCVLF